MVAARQHCTARAVDDRHLRAGAGPLSASTERIEILESADREALALLVVAAGAASDKLAERSVAIDLAELLSVVDVFLITSGRNARQVATIVEEIEAQVKAALGRSPIRIEGQSEASWVLMDYGDVVIHVFDPETREYYDLEHLWSGAPRIEIDPAGPQALAAAEG